MWAVPVVGRVVLAAVLVVASLSKRGRTEATRTAALGLGVPSWLARPGAIALPWVELALGGGLLVPASARVAAGLTALLLLSFTVLVGMAVGRGLEVTCACFGDASRTPVGPGTVVRNVALLLMATVIALVPAVSWGRVVSSMRDADPGRVGLWVTVTVAVVVAAQGWMLLQLMAQNGRLLDRIRALEGVAPAGLGTGGALPVGSEAPRLALPSLDGAVRDVGSLAAAGRQVLVVFLSPGCAPCLALAPLVAAAQGRDDPHTSTVVVMIGSERVSRRLAAEHGLDPVLLDGRRELAEAFGATTTPSAIVVAEDGTVATTMTRGFEEVRTLLVTSGVTELPLAGERHVHEASASRVGVAAPVVTATDLAGQLRTLGGASDRDHLLIFYDPACGFCDAVHDDLVAVVSTLPADTTEARLVSAGVPTRPWPATVVLDPSQQALHAFGVPGTPSAVVVDRDGRLASELAIGGSAVLDLARTIRRPQVRA